MSIAEAQLINKILNDKDSSVIIQKKITSNNFSVYKNEFIFIEKFYSKYSCLPDKETLIAKFPTFEVFDVSQTVDSLVDEILENSLFRRAAHIINESSKIYEKDANAGSNYLLAHIDELRPESSINSTNIVSDITRLDEWKDRVTNPQKYFIASGFPELDKAGLHGFNRKEEFALLMARSGVGKTMVSIKMAKEIWSQGNNVCFISPEMSPNLVGYRFDSANQHFSISSLMYGAPIKDYDTYMNNLKKQSKSRFDVFTLKDFNNIITASKIKEVCLKFKADILFIDGFTYLTDERAKKGDAVTAKLGHIAQDLLNLSINLSIPVISVIQANRRATEDDKVMNTENIAGADTIGASCTRLITLTAKETALKISIPKNRYGVSGKEATVYYKWDKDRSDFFYIPSLDDIQSEDNKELKQDVEEAQTKFSNVF